MALASSDIISVPPPIDSFEKDEAIPFDLLGDVVGVGGGGGRLKQGGKYSKANKIPPITCLLRWWCRSPRRNLLSPVARDRDVRGGVSLAGVEGMGRDL